MKTYYQCNSCSQLTCEDRQHWEAADKECNVRTGWFDTELALFDCHQMLAFARHCLEEAPESWWTQPASSSGKYHPAFAVEEAGLIKHTKAAVLVFEDMIEMVSGFGVADKDIMLLAILFHDTTKYVDGQDGYTNRDHPKTGARWLLDRLDEFACQDNEDTQELSNKVKLAAKCIATHMGRWYPTQYHKDSNIRALQKFVHMADYISSRKFMGNYERS